MSEFDKEAEREKLREQFAEDEKKRETTERMSQLLLQGATMTNAHCDTCGSPLFRYEGQTFCSTCQRTSGEGDTASTEESASTTEDDEPTEEGQRIAVEGVNEASDTDIDTETGPASEHLDEAGATPERTQRSATSPAQRVPPSQSTGDAAGGGDSTGGLMDAERSLVRTVTRQASAAEQASDLGRTREHLAAAREAAEALAAVRQAGR